MQSKENPDLIQSHQSGVIKKIYWGTKEISTNYVKEKAMPLQCPFGLVSLFIFSKQLLQCHLVCLSGTVATVSTFFFFFFESSVWRKWVTSNKKPTIWLVGPIWKLYHLLTTRALKARFWACKSSLWGSVSVIWVGVSVIWVGEIPCGVHVELESLRLEFHVDARWML